MAIDYNPFQSLLFGGSAPFLNIGGGFAEAERLSDLFTRTEEARAARKTAGLDLLTQLLDIQQNPFSIVPALQAFGAAGGGTLAPAVDLARTGGVGRPSPYGSLIDSLLSDLSRFATSAPSEVR